MFLLSAFGRRALSFELFWMLATIYVGISRRNKHEANTHGFLELGAKLSECILNYFDDLRPVGRVMLNPRREIKPMFLQDCLYSQVQTAEKSCKCHVHKGCFSEYFLCTHSAWWTTGWLWHRCICFSIPDQLKLSTKWETYF